MPGALNDITTLDDYNFDLPDSPGSRATRLTMREAGLEQLLPCGLQLTLRKVVQTTSRLIERLLPIPIHIVTAKGFDLKVVLFVLACSFRSLWCQLGLLKKSFIVLRTCSFASLTSRTRRISRQLRATD